MENSKFAFTKRRLESLAMAPDKRVYYQDEGSEGLSLCVTPAGTKTFYVVKWFQGRKVRVPLGKFPTLSVEEARNACRALVTAMAAGTDVQQARQTVTAKFSYEFDQHSRFRHVLEAFAYDEDGNDANDATNSYSAPKARETLAALEENDTVKAVYAAFRFGMALSYEWGPGKTREYVKHGRIEFVLDYPEDFQRQAVALFNQLHAEHPEWNLIKKVTPEVASRLYDINPRIHSPKANDLYDSLKDRNPDWDHETIMEQVRKQFGRIAYRSLSIWRRKFGS